MVESAARKKSDLEKLEKNIHKECREKTQKLKELCRSKYEHQSCVNQALKSLEKMLKYHHLSEIDILLNFDGSLIYVALIFSIIIL